MRFLVTGSEGPGFASPEETLRALEKIVVIPSFAALTALEAAAKPQGGTRVRGGAASADRRPRDARWASAERRA